jgi:hypothetical protein
MPPSVKFKLNIFLATLRYVAQRGVDSALCHIAGSRDSALCSIAQRCDYIFESICKTVLARESGDPGVQFDEKIENLVRLSLYLL